MGILLRLQMLLYPPLIVHNKAVHNNTSALDPRDDPTQNGINKAIVEHHNRGLELLLPKFSYMFQINLERLLAASPAYKRDWLSNFVEARARRSHKLGLEVDMSREWNLMRRFV